ncbi:MAG TPA: hypothetical protein VFM63_02340 [Pyrinomonadaceae bacterium]|nr:hypothetical protein [Pyrinomonadaceae bacterium]
MKAVLILAAVLLLVAAATKSHFARRGAEVENIANAIAPVDTPPNLGQSDEAGPEVKLVLLALWPEGFETNEMQLEPGEYLFIIGNRTGLKEVNVQLQREGRERLAAAVVGGRRRDLKQRVRLTPGIYVVTAGENPEWTCRIMVGQ